MRCGPRATTQGLSTGSPAPTDWSTLRRSPSAQAECFEKLGRLVEASEKYMAVSRRKLGPGAPDAFKRAVATALERVNAVRERLAMLELTIDGDNVADAQVFVDGREIPPALVGATFPVDPGERVVEVVKGSRKVSEKISLKEKEKKSLTLTLPPGEDEPETPTPPTQPTQGTAPTTHDSRHAPRLDRAQSLPLPANRPGAG